MRMFRRAISKFPSAAFASARVSNQRALGPLVCAMVRRASRKASPGSRTSGSVLVASSRARELSASADSGSRRSASR